MLGSVPQKGVERKNKEKMGGERMCIIAAQAKAGAHALQLLEAVWDLDVSQTASSPWDSKDHGPSKMPSENKKA